MNELTALDYMALHQAPKSQIAVSSGTAERADRWAAGAAQRQLAEVVRLLPDAMFKDHPEVVRLTAEVALWERRTKYPVGARQAQVQQTIARLQRELSDAQDALRFAALDDAMDGDVEFARALELAQRAQLLQHRLDAARLAWEEMIKPAVADGYRGRYSLKVASASALLREALQRLKSEHVTEHPELLAQRSQ